jgi:hypothetical protein
MKFRNWLFFSDLHEWTINYILQEDKKQANKDIKKYLGSGPRITNKPNIKKLDNSKFSMSIKEQIEQIFIKALLIENEDEDSPELDDPFSGGKDAEPIWQDKSIEKLKDDFRILRDSMVDLRYFSMHMRQKKINRMKEIHDKIKNQTVTTKDYDVAFYNLEKLGYLKEDQKTQQNIEDGILGAIIETGNDYPADRVSSIISENGLGGKKESEAMKILESKVSSNLNKCLENNPDIMDKVGEELIAEPIMEMMKKLSKRTVYPVSPSNPNGRAADWRYSTLINSSNFDEEEIKDLFTNTLKSSAFGDKTDDYRRHGGKKAVVKTAAQLRKPREDTDEDDDIYSTKLTIDKSSPSQEVSRKEEIKEIKDRFKQILDDAKNKYPLRMLLWCISNSLDCFADVFSLSSIDIPIGFNFDTISYGNELEKKKESNIEFGTEPVWKQILFKIEKVIDKYGQQKLIQIGLKPNQVIMVKGWIHIAKTQKNDTMLQGKISQELTKIKTYLSSKVCSDPYLAKLSSAFGIKC